MAGGFLIVAFLCTLILQHVFPYPFLFLFFGAVMASAWFGGALAGALAVVVSTVLIGYYFVPPFYSFTISAAAAPYFVSYVLCACVMTWVSADRRRAEQQIREGNELLEQRVRQRTEEMELSNRQLLESQAQLAHMMRLMSMSELTASMAHEINQPLTAIVANGYACLGWLKAENYERARVTADRIVQDGTHAGEVVARLRTLFGKGESQRTYEDIDTLLAETMRILREESMRRHVEIRLCPGDGLPQVCVDRVQIQQLIVNLALNAMDAVSLNASTDAIEISSAQGQAGYVVVSVSDRGSGIAPDDEARVYDAFFTTKADGLGMGLSICRSIVEAHEGRLWSTAREGGGTAFHFTLPTEEQ